MKKQSSVKKVQKALKDLGNKTDAAILQRFFKTGQGQYGEGDIFIGVRIPVLRKLAKQYYPLSLKEILTLLKSPIHEERMLSLLILIKKYYEANEPEKELIYNLYLGHTKYINNWDLVDVSAEHIVGAFLINKSKQPLYTLAESPLLWERRIAILSTFHFIKKNRLNETLKIAKMLIADEHNLIHKAVGWMLRETGKKDFDKEDAFLKKHYKKMPRTMLRYAIERFPEEKRQDYLKGRV